MKLFGAALGVLLLCSMTQSQSARAEDGCANPKTSYDRTYCMAKLFMEADKDLNTVYKELSGMLKPDQKKKLVQAQRNWIKFRDTACETRGRINVDCNFKVNKERHDVLADRVRECKTGHCREDLLVQEDWKTPNEN